MMAKWISGYDGPLYYTVPKEGVGPVLDGQHRVLVDESIVPERGAPWRSVVRPFARSFNAYQVYGGHEQPAALSKAAREHWESKGEFSSDPTLAELRSILYYYSKYYAHIGEEPQEGPERDFFDALLDAIRHYTSQDRVLDPTPQTEGEQFARFVLAQAMRYVPDARLKTPLHRFEREDLAELLAATDRAYGLPERSDDDPWQNLINHEFRDEALDDWPPAPDPSRRPRAEDIIEIFTISDLVETWLPHIVDAPHEPATAQEPDRSVLPLQGKPDEVPEATEAAASTSDVSRDRTSDVSRDRTAGSGEYEGRLIFPGGLQDAKPFFKDMKKLQRDFAVEMSSIHKGVQRKATKWFDLASEIIEVMIAAGPEMATDMLWGLDYAKEDCFQLMDAVLRIMDKHGVVFNTPGGHGSLSTDEFHSRARARVDLRYNEMLNAAQRDIERRRRS